MRLKKIQVSGFKSFVDTTTLRMSSDIIGVVGPNGCGKSNVIDAIRWVMGEMSAKNLRGSAMADVIFNGSVNRKPVSRASVELVFDNSDQSLEGPYGVFAEISVKRTLSRDGNSEYFVNNTAARRRDITDIFLGTGLGPRSYSIIEQGMVSRIIEAKPEELRSFVEEASGVSRYRDRRRETETRIRHTRENLERVDDIRRELDAQLKRLHRQSEAARKYREYRAEERQVRSELMAIRHRALTDSLDRFNDEAQKIENELTERETQIEGTRNDIAASRDAQTENQESLNGAQAAFYAVGSEISNVESRIEHARETLESNLNERERLRKSEEENSAQLAHDQAELTAILSKTTALRPEVERGQEQADEYTTALDEADTGWSAWQTVWEQFSNDAAEPAREREVQQTRINEIERQINKLNDRRARLVDESARLESERRQIEIGFLRNEVESGEKSWRERERRVESMDAEMQQVRTGLESTIEQYEVVRSRHAEMATRLGSLEQVQATMLGDADEALTAELARRGLDSAPRLSECLEVEAGWERAVDAILGRLESAFVVDNLNAVLGIELGGDAGVQLAGSGVTVIERVDSDGVTDSASLAARVSSVHVDVSRLFAGVHATETLKDALALQYRLVPGQCAVTRDGVVVEPGITRFGSSRDTDGGMLAREHEIETLRHDCGIIERKMADLRMRQEASERRLRALDDYRSNERRALSELSRHHAELEGRLGRQESKNTQLELRGDEIQVEIGEIDDQLAHDHGELTASRASLKMANELSGSVDERRRALLVQRDELRESLDRVRNETTQALDRKHRLELDYGRMLASRESVEAAVSRLEIGLSGTRERLAELDEQVAAAEDPDTRFGEELRLLNDKKAAAETRLGELRNLAKELDAKTRSHEERLQVLERQATAVREQLQGRQVARQEIVVRRQTVQEQIQSLGTTVDAALESLPEDADEDTWEDRVETLSRRIDRIGPVNLVAIEEFEEQKDRKKMLDEQSEDLYKALDTLEGVMKKIDRETRERFMATYNALNENFQDFFPKLFGGGSAELRLTDDDVLNAGVTVMARPPGKRNTSIALLSGGEKAMTAVSLLFSLFRLNPAPFCLLDEVDAPLDDANVERYCTLLKGLADHTQLIFITHNKITMEIADSLIGVTMGEPGVSRLVAVDVNEAMELAAS